MKKIMILGAGVYQVPLIKTAKRMGLYTIVSSIPGDYPGFAYADKVYYENTIDKEAILEIAKKEKIAAIVTTGTDVAVSTIGYVNNEMKLTGVTEAAAIKTSDKKLMKEAFRDREVAGSAFEACETLEEVYAAIERIGLPVVIKCVDSSGSRGITLVEKSDEIENAFNMAKQYTRRPYVLVEEKMDGDEIGVDGIVINGEARLIAPHNKFTYHINNATIPAGHAFPLNCSQKEMDEIDKEIRKAIKAIGLNNCAFNTDVFIDGENAKIIEIGGRAGATCIPELMSIYYGVDFYETMIKLALGELNELPISQDRKPCMAKLLMSPVDGEITDIKMGEFEGLKSSKNAISIDYTVGESVSAMKNGTNRIGHVICVTDDEAEVDELMEKIYELIYVNDVSLSEWWRQSR